MLLGRMSIPKDHVDLRVTQHRGERHEVNSSLDRAGSPGVATIVRTEVSNFAFAQGPCMSALDSWKWPCSVLLTGEQECPATGHPARKDALGRRSEPDASLRGLRLPVRVIEIVLGQTNIL